MVPISPCSFGESGVPGISVGGSREHFAFLILNPGAQSSGSSGESKSSVKDREEIRLSYFS